MMTYKFNAPCVLPPPIDGFIDTVSKNELKMVYALHFFKEIYKQHFDTCNSKSLWIMCICTFKIIFDYWRADLNKNL